MALNGFEAALQMKREAERRAQRAALTSPIDRIAFDNDPANGTFAERIVRMTEAGETYTITGASGVTAEADDLAAARAAARTFVVEDGEADATITRDRDGAWQGRGQRDETGAYLLTVIHTPTR